jgi:hypothetical protein
MVKGSSHNIKVTVNDNGEPILSAKSSIQFSVNESLVEPDKEDKPTSSGGAFSYLMLLLIAIIGARNVTRLRN